ncbi:RHS repeat-associated core domain-containing protein, partial [Thermoflexus sp.]|uniref:RHS repeat-associated core domain-containing protein n=1 Tax=Thermoflexus sp. TaxID=1969742 RepID=UPI003A102BFE
MVAFFPTDRRFTGQRWEGALGLYDYNARFYDPALGRFLQPDPLVPGGYPPQRGTGGARAEGLQAPKRMGGYAGAGSIRCTFNRFVWPGRPKGTP